ncbi:MULTISPECIES: hypothetical protein [unclassified Bradyrhizobium]|uniref:hypothetical protein n=1 Tax=unclassified Bradyrhizobium TaxID=2631580 RepID=UPI0012EB3DA8|nr:MULTISPECIES: hypothetical protein [unclassified Bradyrhizobium]MCP3464635.1 hypothetical protein [Bradyrhizobium sp. CCGUVB23]
MTESVSNDHSPVASRLRSRKPATVSASALALHLGCSRTYIGCLEAEGVIQRQGQPMHHRGQLRLRNFVDDPTRFSKERR